MENKPIDDFIKQVKEKLDDSMSCRNIIESARNGLICPECGQLYDSERTADALAGMLEIAVNALEKYSYPFEWVINDKHSFEYYPARDDGGYIAARNALRKIQEIIEKPGQDKQNG